MENISKSKAKRILIFLYEYFAGNQTLIMKELLEKNLKITEKDVNKFFRDNKIKMRDYITFFDKGYDVSQLDTENMVYVIKK